MHRPSSARADLLLVLHAHLPYVRHPEYRYALEENWFYEALTDTYLPLLITFDELIRDQIPFRLTLSLSPTLCSMFEDELLKERYRSYLSRLSQLGEQEIRRNLHDETFFRLAEFYNERFERLRQYYEALNGDLIGAFRRLAEAGHLELITVAATHAYLPNLRTVSSKRAQIAVAVEHHGHWLGQAPQGIWLPECGYEEGLDEYLAEQNLGYFFLDTHGVLNANPRPPLGLHAPIRTKNGVAVFGRDLESSRQVWSARDGYPGDAAYRDFYRDVGFDRPWEEMGPYLHPDGIRVQTGYKYYRVTGPNIDLAYKQPYNPWVAKEKAKEHARHFVFNRQLQADWISSQRDGTPVIVAPYDAELFGHWWFEGPEFLNQVCREIAEPNRRIWMNTAPQYLDEFPEHAVCEPAPSSWGAGGYSAMWVDGSNDWIYRHVHRAEQEMHRLAQQYSNETHPVKRRILNQMARELLLVQASDWAFLMKTGTAVKYAVDRVKSHLARFRKLSDQLALDQFELSWLIDLEKRDSLFPRLDYRIFL